MRQRHSLAVHRSGMAIPWRIVPVLVVALIFGVPALAPTPAAAATFFGSPKFQQQYEMGEAILANFWGPLATAQEPRTEPYAEGQAGAVCRPMLPCPRFIATGQRLVQYFDKARMEQNTPGGPVTNGLLAVELITGRVQVGDTQYDPRQPATIAAVGDPTNTFPTYADFAKWQTAATSGGNAPITTLAQPDGSVGAYAGAMNDQLTKIGITDMGGMHNVPLAFSRFRDTVGLPTVGLAITEPFWVRVKVAGMPRVVLTQAFERRVLTYTPDNPDPYKVEFGNIGAHYYQWRYPNGASGSAMGGTGSPPTAPTTPGGGGGPTMMGPAPRSLPLPTAPSGFAIRGVHEFTATDGPPIRALFHPKTGVLHVLTNIGNLFQIDRATGVATRILSLTSADPTTQVFYGADFGPDGAFYAARCLQPMATTPGQGTIHTAEILRVTDDNGDGTVKTIVVLNRLQYPGGELRFNHEVTSLKYGPDGMLYVGMGSHTDHGEMDGGVGEVPETSAVFRVSPTTVNAPFELFAKGIRNPFAAAFRADGKLFIADHGPQNDLPEELNYVQQGKHYGFPYRFGNNVTNPEPDAPVEPPGLTFTAPIPNTGPDSLNPDGLDSENPSYTFLPHSAPGGLVFYGATTGANLFPMSDRGDAFLAMYGNVERSGETRGFTVLRLTLTEGAPGDFTVSVHTFLSGLRRPTDVAVAPDGALIVLESSGAAYPTDQTAGYGRVLEVAPA